MSLMSTESHRRSPDAFGAVVPEAAPSTLAATRERRGFTGKYVAESLGRPASWVTRAEHTPGMVYGEALTDYARILGVTESFLSVRLPNQPSQGVHFRTNRVPQRVLNMAEQHANYVAWMLNTIHREADIDPGGLVGLPTYDIDLLPGGAAEAARLMRAAFGIRDAVEDMAAVLERAGICIAALPEECHGVDAITVATRDGEVPAVTLLASDRPMARLRHTLAHELGHLVLDSNPYDVRSINQREADADLFAGEFLAPYERLQVVLRGITPARIDDLDDLRIRWGVSLSSLVRRARMHQDISENQYRYWYRTLNTGGVMRDSRPIPQATTPSRIATLFTMMSERRYSVADVQRISHTEVAELAKVFGEQWTYPSPVTESARPSLTVVR